MKKVIIINGPARAGKDTFVSMVSEIVKTMNVSSVDKVKEIARSIGWDGGKTDRDRKFLSDLKQLTSDYNDMSFEFMKQKYDEFWKSDAEILFFHIREPENILRAVEYFDASSLLVTRSGVHIVTSNKSDASVFDYDYDHRVFNDGSLDDLKEAAKKFVKELDSLNKTVTIIGSMRFWNDMVETAKELSMAGYCVLSPYPIDEDKVKECIDALNSSIRKKIMYSDIVYVLNKDGYIGESTSSEIEYAKMHGKEIRYFC